jgi:uncharacterized cupredoxin-like copper-binding protein
MGPRRGRPAAFLLVIPVVLVAACASRGPVLTPPISPGSGAAPREVNIIAREYRFDPSPVDLVAGETVLFHLVNAGLEVHEVVIGDARVQAAWEVAEAATVGAPPGPTPLVSVPPGLTGLRVVLRSGERVDVRWVVPAPDSPLIVGCHIPGHWARGMQVPIRFVVPGG